MKNVKGAEQAKDTKEFDEIINGFNIRNNQLDDLIVRLQHKVVALDGIDEESADKASVKEESASITARLYGQTHYYERNLQRLGELIERLNRLV